MKCKCGEEKIILISRDEQGNILGAIEACPVFMRTLLSRPLKEGEYHVV